MEQTLQPVHAKDQNNRAVRGSREHYRASRTRQGNPPSERKPSYLQVAEAAFRQALVTHSEQELWVWVRLNLVESYWNGVEAGATGKVKPKSR